MDFVKFREATIEDIKEKIFSLQLQASMKSPRSYAVNELRSIDWARNEWGHLILKYIWRERIVGQRKIGFVIDYNTKG